MPSIQPQRLQTLSEAPELAAALRAQDKHNLDVATALNSALVRGDTLQVVKPYSASSPLVVPTDLRALTVNQNAWVPSGGGFPGVYARKDALGMVYLTGPIKSGTIGLAAGTAPYAPVAVQQWATFSWTGAAYAAAAVKVLTDGTITPVGGNNAELWLDGVCFRDASRTPYVPSCFPFDVPWPKPYAPSLVIAQCADVTNAASPTNLAAMLPDWVTVAASSQTLIRVRNIPGLLPSTSYAVTLVVL